MDLQKIETVASYGLLATVAPAERYTKESVQAPASHSVLLLLLLSLLLLLELVLMLTFCTRYCGLEFALLPAA